MSISTINVSSVIQMAKKTYEKGQRGINQKGQKRIAAQGIRSLHKGDASLDLK